MLPGIHVGTGTYVLDNMHVYVKVGLQQELMCQQCATLYVGTLSVSMIQTVSSAINPCGKHNVYGMCKQLQHVNNCMHTCSFGYVDELLIVLSDSISSSRLLASGEKVALRRMSSVSCTSRIVNMACEGEGVTT